MVYQLLAELNSYTFAPSKINTTPEKLIYFSNFGETILEVENTPKGHKILANYLRSVIREFKGMCPKH